MTALYTLCISCQYMCSCSASGTRRVHALVCMSLCVSALSDEEVGLAVTLTHTTQSQRQRVSPLTERETQHTQPLQPHIHLFPPHKQILACSRADPPTQCSSHQYMFSHSLSEKLGLKSARSADSVVLKSFLLVGTNKTRNLRLVALWTQGSR